MFETAELRRCLDKATYEHVLPGFRSNLLRVQNALYEHKQFSVIVVIGGVDGAGKGETVNTLHEWMDPRYLETNAFGPRSDEEASGPTSGASGARCHPGARSASFLAPGTRARSSPTCMAKRPVRGTRRCSSASTPLSANSPTTAPSSSNSGSTSPRRTRSSRSRAWSAIRTSGGASGPRSRSTSSATTRSTRSAPRPCAPPAQVTRRGRSSKATTPPTATSPLGSTFWNRSRSA